MSMINTISDLEFESFKEMSLFFSILVYNEQLKLMLSGVGHEQMFNILSVVQYVSGSKFYENERKKEEQMKKRIEEQKVKIEKISDKQLQQGMMEVQYSMLSYSVINLGNFKGGHLHLIPDEKKCPIFPHSHNVKDVPQYI